MLSLINKCANYQLEIVGVVFFRHADLPTMFGQASNKDYLKIVGSCLRIVLRAIRSAPSISFTCEFVGSLVLKG